MTEAPRLPLLPGFCRAVPLGSDRVEVGDGARTVALTGAGLAGRICELLAALDGRHTLGELRARFPELVPHVITSLADRGLVVDADRDRDDIATTSTALAALATGTSPAQAGPRLDSATVVVVGCGPVSGTAAVQLAKAGVGRLVLADAGEVPRSEAAVSPLLPPTAAGQDRASMVRGLCLGMDAPAVEVVPWPTPRPIIEAADLVLIEARREEPDGALPEEADIALESGVAYLLHGQEGLEAVVGPALRPGGRPCHRCMEERRLGHLPRLDSHRAYLRQRAVRSPRPDAFVAAHGMIVAGLVASVCLTALVDPRRTDGGIPHAIVVDLATLEARHEPVLTLPGCSACSSDAGGGGGSATPFPTRGAASLGART